MLKINEFKVYQDLSEEEVIEKVLKKYHITDALDCKIVKKSIDARDKSDVHYAYSFNVKVKNENKYPKLTKIAEKKKEEIIVKRKSNYSPVIIGAGPAGLFCALKLVENGIKPIIIEQGGKVEERIKAVEQYRTTGIIDERCNVQFGEGGAGTFSDGKLTTGISSNHITEVLEKFALFGAPKEITYLNKPHIGTDNLVIVLRNIRKYIEDNGGQYYFNTKFTFYEKNGDIIKVLCEDKQFETDTVVLAIGHSARDTFELLKSKNVSMQRKNFSVGVRIEHLQSMINQSQYGNQTKLKLPAADYKLVYHDPNGRTCYSFCMCPGGVVMASSSEKKSIVTNGMSYYARDGKNANAALLINVNADDFDGDDPLEGMYFQHALEKEAFILGGSDYSAPIQRVEDYHKGVPSTAIGKVQPTYLPKVKLTDLNPLFPEYVNETLKNALVYFDKKISGFNDPDAILTAVETRTSSPVTILRNGNLEMSVAGFYPCGEGAGYAGGITSAAVDGIKVAIRILTKEE